MVTVVSFFKRRDMVASMGEKEVEGEGDEEFDEEGRLDDDLEVVDNDEEFEKDVEKFKKDNADLAEGFENQKR